MSNFIPKITIPVFPVDQESPDPEALRAKIYSETPVWVLERMASALELTQAIYGEGALAIRFHAVRLALGLVSLHGDGAPGLDVFPAYDRNTGDDEAIKLRADWLCENLSLVAIHRLLAEVATRSHLPEEQAGN